MPPSGRTFNDSYNNQNSSFEYNKSAKVVDYGHGSKQGNKNAHYKKVNKYLKFYIAKL